MFWSEVSEGKRQSGSEAVSLSADGDKEFISVSQSFRGEFPDTDLPDSPPGLNGSGSNWNFVQTQRYLFYPPSFTFKHNQGLAMSQHSN